jgi:hypothetical protein
MNGEQLTTEPKKHSASSLYPVPLLAILVIFLLYVFFFAPVTLTLDGYSHLYGAKALGWMLAGQKEAHSYFSYNSFLLPNWLGGLLLTALSAIIPNELALKLLIVLVGIALIASLYFCLNIALYPRHQRAEVLILLLPFGLNAFLTLGFYGFLISSSICIFVLGLILHHGLSMPLRLKWATACLLLVAYFLNPLPVIVSFLFPCAYFIAEALIHWRDGWRHLATALKRHVFDIWPWLPPACLLPWFYLRLSKAGPPDPSSITFNVKARSMALARYAFLPIAPTFSVWTLFTALLIILLAGALLRPQKPSLHDRLRFTSLAVLIVSSLILYLTVPDNVGDGSYIANRFLLYCALFLVLLAFTTEVFDARLLTLCSLLAAFSVIGFGGEYLLVSRHLAPAVADLRLAMESVPRHSRILILGYRMTPNCMGWPLLEMSVPARHWAMASTLKNQLIVLNDYEANSSHFPLQYVRPQPASVVDDFGLNAERQRSAWFEILKSDPDVDFVVSWGTPSGVNNCPNAVAPPFEEAFRSNYDLVYFKEGASRVELWRKRG